MKTQFTLWQKVANTPPAYLLVLFAWLLSPFNAFAVGVTSTPVANNFSASYDGAKVNLSWVNSNRIELTSADASNGNINKWQEHSGTFGTISIDNGILSCTYTNDHAWPLSIIEILLPDANVAGVNSFMFDYTCDNNYKCYAIIREVETNNAWTVYGSDYVDYAPATSILAAPNHAIWAGSWGMGNTHGTYGDRHFYSIGIAPNPGCINNSNVSFTLSNLYFNTTTNQTALKIVRKIGGVPSSVSDGTVIDIAAGSTNSYIDNTISNGNTYYYAVFAEINSVWTKIAESSEVVVGSVKKDVDLSLNQTEVTVPVGGLFTLTRTTADGYDGEISYSISPDGVIDFNESTGVITGLQMGTATITVSASETENYVSDTKTCTVTVTKNFVGDLTIEDAGGSVTLNWFYNLPISLANEGSQINQGGSYSSTDYDQGVRTIVYNCNGGTAFYAKDFKTPDAEHQTSNCKSFSVKLRGDEDSENNLRVIPYSWVYRPNWAAGDLVADPISIEDDWKEVVITPSYFYTPGNENAKGGASGFNYSDFPVGCIAFLPMSKNAVGNKQLQLKDAYFQLINTNGLTSSVKLVRKDGSTPAAANDGTSIYTGAPTTFVDTEGLLAGHTYYYRVFATKDDVTYMSAPVSVTIPGTAKEDPELSLPASSAVLKVGDTYTLEPTVASGYDGTLAYEITAGSDKISLSGSTITAEAAGTATVRVTAPETTEYNQVTANYTVTVLAVPETNLAITNVDGDNVTLSWTIPGIIDLRTAKTTPSIDSYGNCTSKELSISNNNEELTVTYSAVSGWTDNAFSFDVNISNIESLSFEYHGDYTGSVWSGIYPVLYCQNNTSSYWDSNKGTHGLSATEWTSKGASEFVLRGSGSAFDASQTYTEILFVASDEGEVSNGHMYLRNVRYHTTGMTDIDHIVIMRTTDAAATDTVSGTKLYSGRMFHYTDAALSSGMYYYTIFAVYEDGCFPVEYKTFDNRSFTITYKDQGDVEFSGVHATDYPTTHKGSATTNLKKASKDGYAFGGWYTTPACTGDAINALAADTYDDDITLYARWIEMNLHQPGKYQAPDGYGRVLKNVNGHDYEVYLVTYDAIETTNYGALYAGPVTNISDGYRMFRTTSDINTTTTTKGDGWTEFKPYKYYGSDGSCSIDEFTKLNSSSSIGISHYARLGAGYYVRLYVKGYASFALIGKESEGNSFVVKINGETQTYTANTDEHVARFTLASVDEPYFIEITGNGGNNNNFRGFSLQLPDVEHYTVTVAKNDNSYGTVSAASIANVRAGEATYVTDNTLYIAGTTVTATPAENTAEYTYAFDSWSGVPATITEATTVTANFTRTTNEYTLTWDLNGGTVTTAGTGAAVNATGMPFANVAFGTVITAPTVTKDGFQFVGWNETPASTMPAENKTYTAKWATPIVIGSGTTNMNWENVYSCSITGDSIVEFNVDGNVDNGDEKCVDIRDKNFADWWVKITRGFYKATLRYGTPSGGVKVKIMVVDPSTGEPVKETTIDEHHTDNYFTAIWPLDLRDIDKDKTYYVRVIDAYSSTGSKPKVGSLEFTLTEPSTISNTAKTRLDYENVTVPYQIASYDIEQDGQSETCLYIGYQHQADWTVKINRALYKIRILYGKPSASTKLNMYILNSSGETVWTSEQRPTPSGNYELWEIDGLDLTTYAEDDEYTIRIKDTYGSNGSVPYIAYIDFIPKATHTRSGLRVGDYGTICLPYAVAEENIQGAEVYEMEGWPAGSVAVVLNQINGGMEAGHPYIYQATANTATFSYYVDGEEAEAGTHNGLVGSYTKEEITPNANNYIIYNNKLYYVNSLAYVGVNKAYINRSLAETVQSIPAPAPGKKQVRIPMNNNSITDIDQVIGGDSENTKMIINGHLFIFCGDKTYNAQGQLIK